MVVMCTTMALLLSRMLGCVGQVGPVRKRLVRNTRDWAYSKMAIALDVHVNFIIFAVSAVFLVCTVDEKPNVPVRVWVAGYGVQCLVHAVLVWFECQRRSRISQRRSRRSQREIELEAEIIGNDDYDDGTVWVRVGEDGRILVVFDGFADGSFALGGGLVNMFVAMIWSNIGSDWVLSGGKLLSQNAPWLYWLTLVYQAYDFIFVGFCLVAGIVVSLSLYCIIPILNIVAGQEGASVEDVNVLPKYRSHISSNGEKPSVGTEVMVPMDTGSGDLATECPRLPENAEGASVEDVNVLPKYRSHISSNGEKPSVGAEVMVPMDTGSGDSATECARLPENAECGSNDDGIGVHSLSCNYQFNPTWLGKLLKINPTCPLCKCKMLK